MILAAEVILFMGSHKYFIVSFIQFFIIFMAVSLIFEVNHKEESTVSPPVSVGKKFYFDV